MQNAITTLRIQNFKSIKDVTMQPRRVNIIIGEPNVGKSNILEALSLLGGMVYDKGNHFMGDFIRYEEPRQMFYDNLSSNLIQVETDKELCIIGRNNEYEKFKCLLLDKDSVQEFWKRFVNIVSERNLTRNYLLNKYYSVVTNEDTPIFPSNVLYTEFGSDGKIEFEFNKDSLFLIGEYSSWDVSIKPYNFLKSTTIDVERENGYLYPPFGSNLTQVLKLTPALRKEVANILDRYGLKLLVRVNERKLEVIKDIDGIIYSYPYSGIADTLQRLIFYLAAIESNDDAVLLFEEPEAHSFPSYVMQLAQSIVESRNNQFFVVTHNPYLLTEVLEEMLTDDELKPELAIFAAYYENYQTKVYQLTDEEMISARADGLDFFLNLRRFVPEAE